MNVLFTTADVRKVTGVNELTKAARVLTSDANRLTEMQPFAGAHYAVSHVSNPTETATVMTVKVKKNDAGVPVVTVIADDAFSRLVTVTEGDVSFQAPVAMARVPNLPDVYVAYKAEDGAWDVYSMPQRTLRATLKSPEASYHTP